MSYLVSTMSGIQADLQIIITLAHGEEEADLYPSFRTRYRRYPKMDHKYSPFTRLRPLCLRYVSPEDSFLLKADE